MADLLTQFFLKCVRALRQPVIDLFVVIDQIDFVINLTKPRYLVVLGKFGLVWFRAIFARPETRPSGP